MAEFIVTLRNDESDGDFSAGDLSLREALELANGTPGVDTITFDAAVFTGGADSLIRLTGGELLATEAVTIDGANAVDLVLSGDATGDDVLQDGSFVTDVAASLTAAGDANRLDDNSRVLNITAADGVTTLSGLTITGGHTTATGGGVQTSGALELTNATVSGNSTSGNLAHGGGIFTGGEATLTNATVSGNSTSGYDAAGGGVHTSGALELSNVTVSGNSTSGFAAYGGGIFTGGEATLTNATISGNSTSGFSAQGGGIYTGGEVTLTNSTVSGNATSGRYSDGGGIFTRFDATLTNATVNGNSTSGSNAQGGGIYTYFGALEMTNDNFSGNSTSGLAALGGGIFFGQGGATLINSTVSGNATSGSFGRGGGIGNTSASDVTLINSTVSGNSTSGSNAGGGGIYSFGVTLTNSIVLGNVSAETEFDEFDGEITANGVNIIGSGTDADASDGIINADAADVFAGTVDNNGVLAGELADNGGPVETIALLANAANPALDRADPNGLTTDARGEQRDFDAIPGGQTVDLGAFELQEPVVTPDITLLLVNADTDEILGPVSPSGAIDPDLLNGAAFSLIAVFADPDLVESAVLQLNDEPARTEGAEPYALFGDIGDDFTGQPLPDGPFTVTVRGYSQDAAQGELVAEATFILTNSDATPVPPTPEQDAAITEQGAPILIDVLENDGGVGLTLTSIDTPANGAAVIQDNQILYTPNPGFLGVDSFSYVVENSDGLTAVGDVSVTVETPAAAEIDLFLIDAASDAELEQVGADGSLDAASLVGANLAIEARLNTGEDVESFVFLIDDTPLQVENVEPYALFGDLGGDFLSGEFPGGASVLTVQAYSEDNGGGELLAEDQFLLL
ncbi:MAG: hypothetical protein KTR21_10540 [Rhodobacteraceae bacterium]|nr:hypothetical protein [Paracoccaceae bacterium]